MDLDTKGVEKLFGVVKKRVRHVRKCVRNVSERVFCHLYHFRSHETSDANKMADKETNKFGDDE
jgi:hypothetical protein